MKLAAPLAFIGLSLGLHAAMLAGIGHGSEHFEPPRLGPRTITARLVPSTGAATSLADHASGSTTVAQPANSAAAAPARSEERAAQPDDWLPSGKLTRLPVPLQPVELETQAGQVFAGRIELTLLIDREGRVRAVRHASRDPDADAFARQVATRFRAARFAPGEVDGVPVNAILKVGVVSERETAAEL